MEQKKAIRQIDGGEVAYRTLIYLVLGLLAICILIPVAWVFMASVKQNNEFYGNPWTLPLGLYFQNFVDAWTKAHMGEYMLNSVIVTALALVLLLVIALPAAYVLSRFRFKLRKLFNVMFMGGLFINVNYIVVPIFLMFVDGDKTPCAVWALLDLSQQHLYAGGGLRRYRPALHHLPAFRLLCHPAKSL